MLGAASDPRAARTPLTQPATHSDRGAATSKLATSPHARAVSEGSASTGSAANASAACRKPLCQAADRPA